MLPELPMEVWARVASFVPFGARLRVFGALRVARLLPETETHRANAFLQFCSEADAAERYVEECDEEHVRVLVAMGFAEGDVRLALHCAVDIDAAVERLLSA